ncbi:MAG: endo alpha-1,4 polygalactosaminidase [bacterium]|nr:endo alpha-1,4 polygalactosaminidase [bacterium]
MVKFVSLIANYAHDSLGKPDFGIFPQNGEQLVERSGYIDVVNGIGREDVFYGYNGDDVATPENVTNEIETKLDIFKSNGKLVLTIDYATTQSNIDDAYNKSLHKGYIPYVTVRTLDQIVNNGHNPDASSSNDVKSWTDIKHFLYHLQYTGYVSSDSLTSTMAKTYYDLIIMDYSFDGSDENKFTNNQISTLKTKTDTKNRKVIAYMSIGEAEDYRCYWQSDWCPGNPDFIVEEKPSWEGDYKVKYWKREWQVIILGYLKKIIDASFDGVYLDIIDAYEYFESHI